MNHRLYHKALAGAISSALKKLLCEKHLYQCVEVSLEPLLAVSKELKRERSMMQPTMSGSQPPPIPSTIEEISSTSDSVVNIPWTMGMGNIHGAMRDIVPFAVPPINTYCQTCKDRPPFNPIPNMSCCLLDAMNERSQWYHMAYQCQQCHSTTVVFLVRREGSKLRLAGRDPLEVIPPPKVLPKNQAKYFSDAQIAHHAGQTLAAIFLLRTFVEQFWQSIPQVQEVIKAKNGRSTGDEQGSAYQATLPPVFNDQFPSLPKVYSDLSAAMHSANPDAKLFEESCVKIEEHFDARKVFKLLSPGAAAP